MRTWLARDDSDYWATFQAESPQDSDLLLALARRMPAETYSVEEYGSERTVVRFKLMDPPEKPGIETKYCIRCDGCGWHEGGRTIQTLCVVCRTYGCVKMDGSPLQPGEVVRTPDGRVVTVEELSENVKQVLAKQAAGG